MKRLLLIFLFIITSCASKINYLGNYYPPTKKVVFFFDKKDILVDYKVIGLLNREEGFSLNEGNMEVIKKELITKAKNVGADAILVTKFSNQKKVEFNEDILTKKIVLKNDQEIIIEAKLLKYK